MELPNTIEELQFLVLELLKETETLKAENLELRARLGLDSTNSHKPPFSDVYKKKAVVLKASTSSKKQGGQKNHKGKTLKMVEVPDVVISHKASTCSCCHRSFGEGDIFYVVEKRQVFDLPKPRLEVTEHQLLAVDCCGRQQRGVFPSGVQSPVSYGDKVLSFASLLNVGYQMPFQKVSQLFEDLYDSSLNVSTIISGNEKLYERLAPVEERIKSGIEASEVAHFDETGMRVAGKTSWFHTACTSLLCYLFVHAKRGKEALKDAASILPNFKQWAVHDCWASYFSFEQCRHALCNAHILRELQGLIDNYACQWASEMQQLLWELYEKSEKATLIVPDKEIWYERYALICEKADKEEPPPVKNARGKPKNTKGRNLLHRLKTYQTAVLAFAFEKEVPFTNNPAENDIRNIKIKQKVAMSFRTMQGAKVYARIQGALKTFKKQGLNVFQTLLDVQQMKYIPLVNHTT